MTDNWIADALFQMHTALTRSFQVSNHTDVYMCPNEKWMITSWSLYPWVFLLEAILILLVWESLHCLAFTSGTNLIVYLWTDFSLYSLLSHYVPRFVKSSLSTLSNLAWQHVARQNTTDGLLINRPSHMECYKDDSTTHLQKYTQTDIECYHSLEKRLHILTQNMSHFFFGNTDFWYLCVSFLERDNKELMMRFVNNLSCFLISTQCYHRCLIVE